MAILPGLYSLRFLFSFSLLIFSATTSVKKAQMLLIRVCFYIYTHVSLFSPKLHYVELSRGDRGITHVQYHNFYFIYQGGLHLHNITAIFILFIQTHTQ